MGCIWLEEELNEKVRKLWELLQTHITIIEERLKLMAQAIAQKDVEQAGNIAGDITVIGQSDVCYATAIEILEDLKQKGVAG